jgi:hypothetical protein
MERRREKDINQFTARTKSTKILFPMFLSAL